MTRIFFFIISIHSLQNNGTKTTTMLNGKVFKYFARVILFCGKAGSSPFVWDVKTGRLFVSRKLRNKTRSGISVQVGYSIYCVIKAILLTANVGSFYFSISLAYGITINSLLWIPLVVYEKDFAAFMNCSFRFVKDYEGRLRNTIQFTITYVLC